jgi:hypothetical protein
MMKYQAHVSAFLLSGLLLVAACGGDEEPEVLPPAPSITFANSGASAEPGDTVAITVNARAESGITSLTVNGSDITGDAQGETTASVDYPYVVPGDASPGNVSLTFVLTDEDQRTTEEVYTVEVTEPVVEDEVVSVGDNITEDFTMETGKTYLLTDDITVEAGATLTIQEGVTVLGQYVEEDLDSDDVNKTRYRLTIDAGAVIDAQGTAENPIVMTSERAPDGEAEAGDWMGLRINGEEGVSSGTLTYVRIEYGGALLAGGDTEPALRLQQVDQATTIDYLQVFRSVDEGIRARGGSVNMRHLMITECRNSSVGFDDQDGVAYDGSVQYFIVQSSTFAEKDGRDLEVRDDAIVRIANMTMIGSGVDIEDGDLSAIRVRSSAGGILIFNSIIAEYSDDGLRLDAPDNITGIDGEFVLAYSYLFRLGGDATRDDADPENMPLPFETESGTYFVTISEDAPTDAAGIGVADYTPDAAVASDYNSTDLGDFFSEASFIGAVGSENWTSGWSVDASGNANP